MTQLEFDEITDFLNPRNKIERNKYTTLDVTYHYKDNTVTITGNIPRSIIQDIAITFYERKTFMNLLLPSEENKEYIKKIVLDNIDEVVILSLYLDDYYLLKKTGLKSNSSENYKALITEIKRTLINKCDLDMTSFEWIRKNHICNYVIEATQNRLNKNPIIKTSKKIEELNYTRNLKKIADDFDYIVDPFMGRRNSFKELEDILEYVDISLDKNEDNEVKMILTDKQTSTKLIHERKLSGFSNSITYINENKETITVMHEFESAAKLMPSHGEKLVIIKDTPISSKSVLFYNFTTNKTKYNGNDSYSAGMEEKIEFYSELQQAMNMAQETVLQHMIAKKTYTKKH